MFRHIVSIAILLSYMCVFTVPLAVAQGLWTNHTDRNTINSIAFYQGEPWSLGSGGLVRWIGKSYTPALVDVSFPIGMIASDESGRIWAAAGTQLYVYDGDWEQAEYLGSESVITAIACGGDGMVAVGTTAGLHLYDGESWNMYTVDDGLPWNNITSVDVTQDGNVYVGTTSPPVWKSVAREVEPDISNTPLPPKLSSNNPATGKSAGDPSYSAALVKYDGNSWEILREFPSSSGNLGAYVAVLDNNHFFAWQKSSYGNYADGLYYYNADHWVNMVKGDGLPSNAVIAVAVSPDGSGEAWIATDAGMAHFSEGHITSTYTTDDGLSDSQVNTCVYAPDGVVFAGTDFGLNYFDADEWTSLIFPGIPNSLVKCIDETPDGALWFGTEGGVSCLKGLGWTTWTTANALDGDYTIDLRVDSRGRVWTTMSDNGSSTSVSMYEDGDWRTFSPYGGYTFLNTVDRYDRYWLSTGYGLYVFTEDGGVERNVTRIKALFNDPDGGVWALVNDTQMYHEDGGWSETINMPGTSNDWIGDVGCDSEGNVWVIRYKEILRWDGDNWTSWKWVEGEDNGIPYNVTNLSFAPNGDVWCIGEQHAYSRYNNGSWETFEAGTGAPEGIFSIVFGTGGDAWCSIADGIAHFDGNSWTTYDDLSGSMVFDQSDRLWVVNEDYVRMYDSGEWVSYTGHPGAVHWPYGDIMFDSDGDLWFSSLQSGLFQFSPTGTGVAQLDNKIPTSMTLLAYPNPFNATITLRFELPLDGMTSVSIYSISGQKVRTCYSNFLPAGTHEFRWDGLSDSGVSVASGLYFARVKSGDIVASASMTLLK